jgi:hypothetical protein
MRIFSSRMVLETYLGGNVDTVEGAPFGGGLSL